MKERFIENGIEYVRNGDYYIPNLTVPEGTYTIGRYGKLHLIFIKENRPAFYSMKMLKSQLGTSQLGTYIFWYYFIDR